jgi:hypothetical protein
VSGALTFRPLTLHVRAPEPVSTWGLSWGWLRLGTLECPSRVRCHHLIKTFYGGPGGWTDRQLPDGTIVFTAPTGHVYSTEPHGGALFSALAALIAQFDIPKVEDPANTNRVMMPRRRQTHDQDRQDRINAERREWTELIAEEERQRQAWLAANYEPPPF